MSVMKEGSLGAILHKSQIISEDDIRAALDEQSRTCARFGEALVALGIVTQEDIDWALSHQLDIPYVRIRKDMIDAEAVALVPAAIARKYELLPLVKAGEELSIAIADPLNKEAIAAVQRVSGCKVTLSMGLIREIREMQDECYGPPAQEGDGFGFASTAFSPAVLSAINADLTGAKLLEYLLLSAMQSGAVSLLFVPGAESVMITGRKDGKHRQVGRLPRTKYDDFLVQLKRTAGIVSRELSGIIAIARAGETAAFAVSLLATDSGDVVTLRRQEPRVQFTSLADLAGDHAGVANLRELVAAPKGIIFIAVADDEMRSRVLSLIVKEVASEGRMPLIIGNVPAPYPHLAGDCLDPAVAVAQAVEQDVDVVVIADLDDPRAVRAARRPVLKEKVVVGGVTGGLDEVISGLAYYHDRGWLVPADIAGIIAVSDAGCSAIAADDVASLMKQMER